MKVYRGSVRWNLFFDMKWGDIDAVAPFPGEDGRIAVVWKM